MARKGADGGGIDINARYGQQQKFGAEFDAFISKMKTPVPKHLTSVPELYRYGNATSFLVMASVREAYEKGLHLKGVDYCCPPVVLVYEDESR